MADINAAIESMEPLPGAVDMVAWLRVLVACAGLAVAVDCITLAGSTHPRLWLLGRGRCGLTLLRRFLHRSELLAGGVDVSDRTSDLADLLIIGVLTLNLVLKVLLQLLVLQLNLF